MVSLFFRVVPELGLCGFVAELQEQRSRYKVENVRGAYGECRPDISHFKVNNQQVGQTSIVEECHTVN